MRSWTTTHESAGAGTMPGGRSTGLPYPTIAGIAAMVIGAWLFVSPLVFGYGQPARLNDMLVGAAAAMTGLILTLRMARPTGPSVALGLLGGWLIISPLALPQSDGIAWNAVAVGAFLVTLALVGTVQAKATSRRA
jgi:hypothetical protein